MTHQIQIGKSQRESLQMQKHFDTKEAAEDYKTKHDIRAMEPEYLPCRGKWAIVYPIKAQVEKKVI